jgi:hypothetical protein
MGDVALATPATMFVDQRDSSDSEEMPKEKNTARISSMYRRLMRERDAILANLPTPPAPEPHLSIAVFEAWADGVVDDDRLHQELSKYHKEVRECSCCSDNLEFYKKRRNGFCRIRSK